MAWLAPVVIRGRIKRYGITAIADSIIGTSGFMLADLLRFGTRADLPAMAVSASVLFVIFGVANRQFGVHRRLWRYASLSDAWAVACAVVASTLVFSLFDYIQVDHRPYWLSTVPNGAVLAFLLLLLVKLRPSLPAMRLAKSPSVTTVDGWSRALVVGAGQTGMMLARDFQVNRISQLRVVGFVDDDPAKLYRQLNGIPVCGTRADIPRLVQELRADLIVIAIPSSARNELDDLISICQKTGARVQIVPSLSEIATRPDRAVAPRELDIADLLGREEVRLDVAACARYIEDRVVLVTGAAGSIGSELCRQLIHLNPRQLVILDVNETGLFDLDAELRVTGSRCAVTICMADITDEQRVERVFQTYRPHVVFHAAAYKHVPLLETHPAEAVKANVLGTALLCRASHESGVERFVFISSDKAVAAANNLGYSKRIGELLVRAYGQGSTTVFCAVRFGNVIGSRGSVVPTFERQIVSGGPVTVTHPEVTRFFMSIPEAACLVIQAAANAASGSIFMLDMGHPVSIVSLAEKMIRLRGLHLGRDIEIVFTGLRPGEKMHEELTTAMEDTQPTSHGKIMEVIDPRLISRAAMDVAVRTLVLLARRATDMHVQQALRDVAQGRPVVIPAVISDQIATVPAVPGSLLSTSAFSLDQAITASLDDDSIVGASTTADNIPFTSLFVTENAPGPVLSVANHEGKDHDIKSQEAPDTKALEDETSGVVDDEVVAANVLSFRPRSGRRSENRGWDVPEPAVDDELTDLTGLSH